MSSNSGNSQSGSGITTRVDPAGNTFQTPAAGPAPNGTSILINGGIKGTLVGGYAIKDKQ